MKKNKWRRNHGEKPWRRNNGGEILEE